MILFKKLFIRFLLIFYVFAVFLLIFACQLHAKSNKPPFSTNLKPGDEVCLWDIDPQHDLLASVNIYDIYGLTYKYTSPTGKEEWRLWGSVTKMRFILLWPGIKVSGRVDEKDKWPWFSALVYVKKNGYTSKLKNPEIMSRIGNRLIKEGGRARLPQFGIVRFNRVRFKKKGLIKGCRRKYKSF